MKCVLLERGSSWFTVRLSRRFFEGRQAWQRNVKRLAVELFSIVHWRLVLCAACFPLFFLFFLNLTLQRDGEVGSVRWDWVLPEERKTSAFIFVSEGNRHNLVHVLSFLLSTAVQAVGSESPRSRPLSCSVSRSASHPVRPSSPFISSGEGERVVDLSRGEPHRRNKF